MNKQRGLALLAGLLMALLLCSCSQYDDLYDDSEVLTGTLNHYAALLWSNSSSEGRCTMKAGSFSGVYTLKSFTVTGEDKQCKMTSTLRCTKGDAKLLLVNTDESTLVAQWPMEKTNPDEISLPAGHYSLRLAGRSAAFNGEMTLTLDGQPVAWEDTLQTMKHTVNATAENALQEVADTLQRVLDSGKQAA